MLHRIPRPLALLSVLVLPVRADERSAGVVPRGGSDPGEAWIDLGDAPHLAGWSNLERAAIGAVLALPGTTRFAHDTAKDWSGHYGLRFDLFVPKGRLFDGTLTLRAPEIEVKTSYRAVSSVTRGEFSVVGNGFERIDVPFSLFDHFGPFVETFRSILSVELSGKFRDGRPGHVELRRVRRVRAPKLELSASTRSRAAEAGDDVEYEVRVSNCSDRIQAVVLSHHPFSKHVMQATVEPEGIVLKPQETKTCRVRINVSDRIPPGGRERQEIRLFY